MSVQTVILLFTLMIYLLILVAFNKARKKYSGGKVGEVINLILFTVFLLFLADYVRLLAPFVADSTLVILQSLFRTAGLSVLAYGGARISA